MQTPEAPEQDSHTPEARPLNSEIHTVQDFEDTSSRSVGGAFLVNLTKLCSVGASRGIDYAATVKSPICRTVQLHDSDSFFRKICQEPGTQKYLNPKYVWNRYVYLVTGIKTIEDASITVAQSKNGSKKAKVTFPVSKSLSGINFDYSMLDCSIDFESSRAKGNSTRFKVPGEKVY